MTEVSGYGNNSNYYSEEQHMRIAAIASREGVISSPPVNMAELFKTYRHMVLQDAFEITMQYAEIEDATISVTAKQVSQSVNAKALLMANHALSIVENGGDLSAEEYIGSGSLVHDKAIEFLPLVKNQRYSD